MNNDNWINKKFVTVIDEFSGERIKDRRRRIFEGYCFACLSDSSILPIDQWDWNFVHQHVERLISESDKFAEKEIE